mmetsp:Transcript_39991/g.127209  ORF Transcript_39991/g.127209 Transcript_39991/m.127209 type:complete len:442 (+) Transcript_39991:54-1379(+)
MADAPRSAPPSDVDVAIVGAGVAGLACAARLREQCASLRVAVFEAGSRIGGRACPVSVGPFHADAGAGWIHGVDGNPLLEDGVLTAEDVVPCTEGNIWTSGPGVGDSTNFHPTEEETARWERRLAAVAKADAAAPEGEPIDLPAVLRSTGEAWGPADERLLRGLEMWFGAAAGRLAAGDMTRGSQLGDFPGPHAIVRGGMALVAERLLQRAGGAAAVQLRADVQALEEDEGGVVLRLAMEGGPAAVRARWVVCTAALGVLQRGQPAVEPPLPPEIRRAVETLQMSRYCKCFLALPEDVARGLPTWTWTDHALFPMAFNYYALKGVPLVSCNSIDLSVGAMEDAAVLEQALAALDVDASTVVAHHVTRWHAEPRFGGSYSFSPRGCDFTEIDSFVDAMAGRRLLFAGEHTHDEHQGSVHGAYLSGLRAAEELLARARGEAAA